MIHISNAIQPTLLNSHMAVHQQKSTRMEHFTGTDRNWHDFSCFPMDTLVKFSTKHLYAHDGKDKPEDKTHQQYIENGRDGIHEGIYHYLEGRQK